MMSNTVEVVVMFLVLLDVKYVYVCGKLEHQVTAAVGDSVTLPCTTTLSASVDWRYHDSPFHEPNFVYSNYQFYDRVTSRFAISNHSTSTAAAVRDFSLVINNVQLNDTGLYTCWDDGGVATKHTVALLVLPSLSPSSQRTSSPTQTTPSDAQPPSTTETSSSATVGLIVVVVLLLVLTVAEGVVIALLYLQRRKYQKMKGASKTASAHLLSVEGADPSSAHNTHNYVALQPIQHTSPVVGHASVAVQVPDGNSGFSDQETAAPLYQLVGCVQPTDEQPLKSAAPTSPATDDAAAAPVCGVGVLGDCLYVIRRCRQQSEVEIYDRHSLARRSVELAQRLRVHPDPVCMAACPSHQCLYIAYSDPVSMVERQAVAGTAGNAWEIKSGKPVGISVTTMAVVIVTLRDSNKLVEFNADGSWKRDVVLQLPAASPCHAIQLQVGKYLVSFGSADDGGVCLVDVQGRILKAVDTRTSRPTQLAADDRGFVFVCDAVGNRVTLIDAKNLDYVVDVLPTSAGLQMPTAVSFDETSTRMFVGEYCDNGRVLAFRSLDVKMHYRC